MLDVIVVSAFGRETWLLKKLKEQGLNFKSFDVTDFFYKTPQSFTVPFGMVNIMSGCCWLVCCS